MLRTLPLLVAAGLSLAMTSVTRGQDFVFSIDPVDGHTMIESDVPFRGFSLQSDTDALLPEHLPLLGQSSPVRLIALDLDASPALVLTVLSFTAGDIAAGTFGTPIPPGTYDLGPIVDIAALDFSTEFGGLSLLYVPADINETLPGLISIPEPTTALWLVGGVLLSLRRRTDSALGIAT
ncbi:MAG: hypothetical protein AAF561_04105 [Planctomycetota bacterium]